MAADSDEDPGSGGFSEQERAAMKQRAAELRTGPGRGRGSRKAADERDVLTKIAGMEPADRALAERLHEIVTSTAPDLSPKLWYGQPAYARAGRVVCFFRSGHDDKERYSTFGFTPEAALDDDSGLWATAYAVADLDDRAEEVVVGLVRRAAGLDRAEGVADDA